MDFMRAATFPFDDDEWLKKLGIATLIQFIPLVGQMVLQGWSFEISRRVKQNDVNPLPDWEEFMEFLKTGFIIFVANLVYQIPTVIFACIMMVTSVLPAMGGDSDAAGVLAAGVGFVAICLSCVIFLYALAAAIVFYGGYVRYIERPELSTFFQFGDNIALVRNNLGDFGSVLLYMLLAGLLIGAVSGITAGIGGLLATPFFMYFMGHLLGQLSRKLSGSEPVYNSAPAV